MGVTRMCYTEKEKCRHIHIRAASFLLVVKKSKQHLVATGCMTQAVVEGVVSVMDMFIDYVNKFQF